MHAGGIDRAGIVGRAENALSPKLVQAAQEFEGLMMKELLKPMTSDRLVGGEDEDDSDVGSGGALGEFASEALGQALSQQGGLGIADRIVRDLTGYSARHDEEQVTEKSHQNTM
jgi:peptidoglycan hydrolase FlgJ